MRHTSSRKKSSASDAAVVNKSSSCKGDTLVLGTWNVRTFRTWEKRRSITNFLNGVSHMIGISEVRIEGTGSLLLKDFVLHYYGVEGGQKGVGLLVKNEFNHLVKSVTPILQSKGRILVVTLKDFNIIVAYAPTECGYSRRLKEEFYDLLDKAMMLCNINIFQYM